MLQIILFFLGLSLSFYQGAVSPQTYQITSRDICYFPKNFYFGAGTAAQQVEEDNNETNWGKQSIYAQELARLKQLEFDKLWASQVDGWVQDFYKKHFRLPTAQEKANYKAAHYTFCFAGDACQSYSRYQEDIAALKQIGCNAYRFSVCWQRVMPTPTTFDMQTIEHYRTMCDELRKNGIKPAITLYHYAEPNWFSRMGSFEKKENIIYFVTFCEKLFTELSNRVELYFTFNAPVGGIALNSYMQGKRPPFKKDSQLTAQVIKNILDAHVAVYEAKEKINPTLKVGILKNVHQLDPWHQWNPVDILFCKMGNKLQDQPFYDFFTTGNINMRLPIKIKHHNSRAPYALDFIGINYYGHRYMSNGSLKFDPQEERCGVPGNYHETYTIYPKGIYRAIKSVDKKLVKPLKKKIGKAIPIYITENGIGTENEEQRIRFMKEYLKAIAHAIKMGYNVQGYFYWSLLDNYEWGRYSKRYGLFAIDSTTGDRIMKDGARYYQDLIAAHNQWYGNNQIAYS